MAKITPTGQSCSLGNLRSLIQSEKFALNMEGSSTAFGDDSRNHASPQCWGWSPILLMALCAEWQLQHMGPHDTDNGKQNEKAERPWVRWSKKIPPVHRDHGAVLQHFLGAAASLTLSTDTDLLNPRAPELLWNRWKPWPCGSQHPEGEGGRSQGERRVPFQLQGSLQDKWGKRLLWEVHPHCHFS